MTTSTCSGIDDLTAENLSGDVRRLLFRCEEHVTRRNFFRLPSPLEWNVCSELPYFFRRPTGLLRSAQFHQSSTKIRENMSQLTRHWCLSCIQFTMIRKLKTGEYRLYSRKRDKQGKRKNLGTFSSREQAEKHERQVQFFKRAG
jgi:hypothetical protein